LALKQDGTVVGWGWNNFGQATVPPGLSNIIAVAAGWHDSLVLRSDGTVFGWGDRDFGEASPPAGLNNVVAISSGQNYCMAITADLRRIAIEKGNDGPKIRFHTFPGLPYAIEYAADPRTSQWTVLGGGALLGTGGDVEVTDADPAAQARFYRVQRAP
jgi:hypothetical protein